MALVHHCIVWTAFGGRHKSRGKYLILGDDVVIFSQKAYLKYCAILESLGISYTNNFSVSGFEFAKRVFHQGKEITGAYTAALWASRNEPELFALEWRNLSSRGYSTGTDLPMKFKVLLKCSNKKLHRCKLLMTIPYGTEIKVEDLSKFVLDLSGRSSCFLNRGDNHRHVEVIKPFRQAASFLIQQQFQKLLDESKSAIEINSNNFAEYFKNSSGLKDQLTPIIPIAIKEYQEHSKLRVRYLERDLKKTYLGGTRLDENNMPVPVEPTNKVLLRPNLPHIPRKINFKTREKHMEQLRFRAKHQMEIIKALSLD
jgi:hypothetical protein